MFATLFLPPLLFIAMADHVRKISLILFRLFLGKSALSRLESADSVNILASPKLNLSQQHVVAEVQLPIMTLAND